MKALLPLLALAMLAACNGARQEDNSAAVQQGVDRSIEDVRAAQAAAAKPVDPSVSAGARANAARNRADALHEKAQARAAQDEARRERQEPADEEFL